MNLPILSCLKTVGELRSVQAGFEKAGPQNPDSDVAPIFNEDCLLKLVAQSKKG